MMRRSGNGELECGVRPQQSFFNETWGRQSVVLVVEVWVQKELYRVII